MMSELSFDINDTYPFIHHEHDMNDMMILPYKHEFTMIQPLIPLSPDSDDGSFADSVMSSNSSQQQQQVQQQQQQQQQGTDEYHQHEPLTPLPADYFINMAQLQQMTQQQQQQQPAPIQVPQQQQQQEPTKPMILHTTPPTSPTEVKSTKPEKPVKKSRNKKSSSIKPEPEEQSMDDDIDIPIDPNLPPDMIRELLQEQNLKKKRLARKAELARMSRKRKKTRMGDLELECERLHAEIDRLRKMRRLDMEEAENKQQQAVAAATAQQQQQMTQQDGKFYFDSKQWIDVSDHQKTVNDAIQAMADAARTVKGQEDTSYMNTLHETFVSHFNHQLIASEGHIAALENHIQPCMPLQFLSWVMSQPDKFMSDNTGLWNSLFHAEIGVTSDQMKEIMALRTTVKKQRKVGPDVEKAYKKLSHSLRRQMLQCNENLTKLRSILTPLQLAKYFDWVNRFGHVCVKINL